MGQPAAVGAVGAAAVIGTGDNKKRNQGGGNGWGKRRELNKHLGSKGKDMDGEREGGFWSQSNISCLDGWVARGAINQNRGGQGWGAGRSDAELF